MTARTRQGGPGARQGGPGARQRGPVSRRHRRHRAAPWVACGVVAAALAGAGAPAPADAAVVAYEIVAAGSPEYYVVQKDVTSLYVELSGASGENGQDAQPQGAGGEGGLGGTISGRITMGHGIRVGDLLAIYPGMRGGQSQAGNPLAGGRGGPGTPGQGAGGGAGGGGSGLYDTTTGRWLLVAGGGGGGSGTGSYDSGGVPGGGADAPGRSSRDGRGGAAGGGCPELGADQALLAGGGGGPSGTALFNGGGGGGGGGCFGGGGGAAGGFGVAGGGGGGGRSWNFAEALDVARGTAGRGNGLAKLVVSRYQEPVPTILSPDRFDLSVGQPVVDDFVSSGTPPPDLHVSGAFPSGVRFSIPPFSGRGEIRGIPEAGSEGTYRVTITATNDFGSTSQTFELVVHPPSTGS